MKTRDHKHYFTFLCAIVCIFFISCKKFVSIHPPIDQAQTEEIFENDQAAISATVGLYSQIMFAGNTILNSATTIYPSLSADEFTNTVSNPDYDSFVSNDILLTASGHMRLWRNGYRYIYHANTVIAALEQSMMITDSIRRQLQGEMLFMRALLYSQLSSLYGDIPLTLSKDYQLNQSMPRTKVDSINQQIIVDLLRAKSLLKEQYATPGRMRPNKWAATALLARMYLYMKDWPSANQQASEIINSNTYTMVPILNNVFLAGSAEAILQITPVGTINTSEGNQFNPATASARPSFALTNSLLSAFETNDQRKTSWTKTVTISGQPYTHPFKYKVRTGGAPYAELYTYFRLAEQYLIRAEARAQMDDIAGAQQDINKIRNRAGLPNTTANTKTTLLQAIEKERRIELMFEWGHRWADLKRWNRANDVLAPVKGPSWQTTDQLYPIPESEIETNPFLVQNPGY